MQQLQCVALNYSPPPPLSLTLILLSLLILHCIFPCPPNFPSILFLLFRLSLIHASPSFFYLWCSLCLHLLLMPSFLLLCSSSFLPPLTLLLFLSPLNHPPPPHPFLLSVSSLYLSPALSALRRVSAITPLHLLIPVLIQPSTHSCLTSMSTALSLSLSLTYTHACRLHKCP